MSESMTIPNGLTCGECRMFPKCSAIIGVDKDNKECDFFPVKFSPSLVLFADQKRELAELRARAEKLEAAMREVDAIMNDFDDLKTNSENYHMMIYRIRDRIELTRGQ